MSATGRMLGGTVRHLPQSVIRRVAGQYSAGATAEDALREVRALAAAGMSATISVLGEAASTTDYAESQLHELRQVLLGLALGQNLDVHFGMKLTGLGIDVSEETARHHLRQITTEAARAGCGIEVDMEQLEYVDRTLESVRDLRQDFDGVTAVVQAYLHRTDEDVPRLINEGTPTRVVKGTYKEGPRHAYQLREVVRDNFLALVRRFLLAGVPVAIATHDEYLVYCALRLIQDLDVPRQNYEFQMIMGIQETLRGTLVNAGHPVRVTVHFGSDLHKWSARRLKENPELARHVVSAMRESLRSRDVRP